MIMDIYRDCFSRIFIFSPSIEVDMTWRPVKEYIEKHMKVKNTAEEPVYFDHYSLDALANILETQLVTLVVITPIGRGPDVEPV